jgi:hypothetical protein
MGGSLQRLSALEQLAGMEQEAAEVQASLRFRSEPGILQSSTVQ